MATIRKLEEADIAEVSRLFLALTPESRWSDASQCEEYLRRLLLENPWVDLDVPSWLAEQDGQIVGFYLLVPRRMLFRGEVITVAVGCQMSVAPEHRRSLVALQLAKAALTGQQDLTIADGAHEKSRDMWRALGGDAPLIYNLHWIRPLRPAQSLLQALGSRKALPRPLQLAARPLAVVFDRIALSLRWNRFLHETGELQADELRPDLVCGHFEEVVNGDLRPAYDPPSLAWLLQQAEARSGNDRLRGRCLRRSSGEVVGWFLYSLSPGGSSEVLQIAARRGDFDRVLCHLLADAYHQGAASVRGRGEPRQVETLSERHCWFRREGKCALVHSRHSEIRAAIENGRAFLSRLEGEWWLRLVSA